MLVFIWMCVMTQAFMPGGLAIAQAHATAYEARLRAELDNPPLIGAASHVARPLRPLKALAA
ncbi:hypothetical protein U91I_03384 [alpha proteobacterium U9-1i]|nr:hypothetical protein U91I_03384 [alpha proteobacterium U9-1i]